MKTLKFPVMIERDEDGWYVGTVPSLKGCHTQARSLDVLEKRLGEVIKLCVEVQGRHKNGSTFVGVHQIEVAV